MERDETTRSHAAQTLPRRFSLLLLFRSIFIFLPTEYIIRYAWSVLNLKLTSKTGICIYTLEYVNLKPIYPPLQHTHTILLPAIVIRDKNETRDL